MNAFEMLTVGISVLGWCLVQFIWQAAVVGLVYALARWMLPRGNPRYLAAMLAMLALAAWPIATVWHELAASGLAVNGATENLTDVVVTGAMHTVVTTQALPAWQMLLNAVLPWLVLAWAAGVAFLGLRVFRQWRSLRVMLRAAEHLPAWQARAHAFAEQLGLRRMVPVLASVRVATPTLIGWVRPAVVLPLAVLARMPAAQIDLILAHELSHLKRFDHIANLFQVVLETLFFYHPVVHWISREARNERELCCDALALKVTGGERREFVAALANLEAFRTGHAELVLAASGGVLVERAWFIAGTGESRRAHRHARGHALLLLAVTVLLGLGWSWWRGHVWQQRIEARVAASNASLLRIVQTSAMQPLAPLVVGAMEFTPHLLPALVRPAAPAVETPDVTRLKVATPLPLQMRLPQVRPQLAPVASVVPLRTMSQRAAVATAIGLPQPIHTERPVYPSAALLAGTQGRVVVAFTLDAAGVPRDLQVVGRGTGPFDAAALRALQGWRFAPPATPGQRYRQAFTFVLGNSPAHDAAAARPCLITTGTHICRSVQDAGAAVNILSPSR